MCGLAFYGLFNREREGKKLKGQKRKLGIEKVNTRKLRGKDGSEINNKGPFPRFWKKKKMKGASSIWREDFDKVINVTNLMSLAS